jgi:hypothetical protein
MKLEEAMECESMWKNISDEIFKTTISSKTFGIQK